MVKVACRRRLPSLVSAATVVLLATALWWQAGPAHAEDATVAVQSTDDGGRYAPAEVTIAVDETVTWVWEGDNHSVTHDPEQGPRLFDSHPACEERDPLPNRCSETGEEDFRMVFAQAGTYPYTCRIHGEAMTGTVVVTEASEEPSPTTSPTPARPSPTQDRKPSPTSEPEPSPEQPSTSRPDAESEPAPSPSPSSEPVAEPEQREAPPPSVDRDPTPDAPAAGTPTVAAGDASPTPVPDPSFEEFPGASEPTGGTGVSGEVAIGGSDDGNGTARTVWAVAGVVSVVGTLGALGRTVLFADAWDT